MRIASLLPSATDIITALGAGDELVCVTHLCPQPEGRTIDVATVDPFAGSNYTQDEIATYLRMMGHQGQGIFALDEGKLASCEPEVIFAQGSCELCSTGDYGTDEPPFDVPGAPRLITLQPHNLGEVLADIRRIGRAIGRAPEAEALLSDLKRRMMDIMKRASARPRGRVRRVAIMEWADPPMAGGLWLPELVEVAGGLPVVGTPGRPAVATPWNQIVASQPDVFLIVLAGLGLEDAADEATMFTKRPGWTALPAVRSGDVFVIDGSRFAHQPTPRIMDSLELFASLLHRETFAERTFPDAYVGLS